MITLNSKPFISEIERVIKDPEIFERISEDGVDINTYRVIPKPGECNFTVENDNGEIIGLWQLFPRNSTTFEVHCNLLKKHRGLKKEFGRLLFEWFVNKSPASAQKLFAEIPVIYDEVYNYAKSFGFRDEGVNRKSIKKRGEIVDQYIIGLTRDDAKEYLEVNYGISS